MNDIILVISGQVVSKNSKVNFPDLNYPKSGDTILRTIHKADYEKQEFQLDGPDGPWFNNTNFPDGVRFFKEIKKTAKK